MKGYKNVFASGVLVAVLLASNAGWADGRRLAGMSFESPERVAAAVTLLEHFCGEAARVPDQLAGTDTKYALRAGLWGLLRGEIRTTVRRTIREGSDVLHIHQEGRVSSREQVDDSYVDIASGLPLEHVSRIVRPDGELIVNTLLWDHLGGRLFVEKTKKKSGVYTRLQRRQYRLGEEVPADAVDPLSVLLLYRARCMARGRAEAWSVPVIEANRDIYDCAFRPAGAEGRNDVMVVQSLVPRSPNCDPATMTFTMDARAAYLPARFSGSLYGLKVTAASQGAGSK